MGTLLCFLHEITSLMTSLAFQKVTRLSDLKIHHFQSHQNHKIMHTKSTTESFNGRTLDKSPFGHKIIKLERKYAILMSYRIQPAFFQKPNKNKVPSQSRKQVVAPSQVLHFNIDLDTHVSKSSNKTSKQPKTIAELIQDPSIPKLILRAN